MPLQATSGAASYDGFGGGVAAVPQYIEDVFSTYLYTGAGATQSINNGIDVTGKGALVWLKNRSSTNSHFLFDTARGVNTGSQALSSNLTDAGGAGADIAFSSTGFDLTQTGSNTNGSGSNYASWTFRKQPKFFDIQTWTGNSTAGRQISHALGSTPGCIIVKSTTSGSAWIVYHRGVNGGTNPEQYQILLNSTNMQGGSAAWNSTAPTSTNFTVGTSNVNASGETYVAYLFAHNAGGFGLTGTDNVISCGSYTGNGTDGLAVTLGYEPQFVMSKRIDTTGNWFMQDIMRGIPNAGSSFYLYAQSSGTETDGGVPTVIPTATGFTLPSYAGWNASGGTYIYIAIRRGPMKVPTLGTSVYQADYRNATAPGYTSGFPVDLVIDTAKSGDNRRTSSRLQGAVLMQTNSAIAETSDSSRKYDYMDGWSTDTGASSDYLSWMFKRAPGYMDVVCYTGTGVARTVEHNLTVVPELIIVKNRVASNSWITYCAYLPAPLDDRVFINSSNAKGTSSGTWKIPTTTTWGMDINFSELNTNGSNYVSYLFATCAGVSKVGSYTGTGTTLQIDCGFTGGARFVLIKRTNSASSDWYVWDSARGIVAGNDPYLLLNSTAAEVTSTDYIDTYSAGFEISSTAPAAINGSGDSFIFLAIA